jgi:hypothetical protein
MTHLVKKIIWTFSVNEDIDGISPETDKSSRVAGKLVVIG